MNDFFTTVTWRPKIGDPNILGLTIAICHLVTGLLCLRVGFQRDSGNSAKQQSALSWVWLALGFSMIFLGLNKQLDLQTLLTQFGRFLTKSAGLYDRRKGIQTAFVACMAVAGLVFVAGNLYVTRKRLSEFGFALVGVASLVAFAVFRAATFNHLEKLVNRLPFYGAAMNTGLELGGSMMVSLGALLAILRNKARTLQPHVDAAIRS